MLFCTAFLEVTVQLALPLGVGVVAQSAVRESLCESKVIVGRCEQLVPYQVQDQESAFVQHSAEATRIAFDLI